MKILIDNGHGSNTPGKCSPDGRLKEYAYAREIAVRLEAELRKQGVDAERIVKEEIDVPLSERCRRANEYKSGDTILVSIHCQFPCLSILLQREMVLPGCRRAVGKHGLRQVRRKPTDWLIVYMQRPDSFCRI